MVEEISEESGERARRTKVAVIAALVLVLGAWFVMQRSDPARPPAPAPRAELVGVQDMLREGAGWTAVLDQEAGARWKTSTVASGLRFALHLASPSSDHRLEVGGGPGLVSTGSISATGRFEARLTAGDAVVWTGVVRVEPPLSRQPFVKEYDRAVASTDPRTALTRVSEGLDPWARATLARWAGRQQRRENLALARELYLSATSTAVRLASPTAAARLLRAASHIDLEAGRLARARGQLAVARAIVAPLEAPWWQAPGLQALLELRRARPHAALHRLREDIEVARYVGNLGKVARTQQKLGLIYVELGRFRDGIDLLNLGLEGARRPVDRAYALANLAAAHLSASEAGVLPEPWAAHRSRLQSALQAMANVGTSANRSTLRAQLAYVALKTGDVSEAGAHVGAIEDWSASALGLDAGFCWLVRADLELVRGDRRAARALLVELSRRLRERLGHGSRAQIAALLRLARLEGTPDRPRLARLEEAWRAAHEATAQLPTPDSRSHFLHSTRRLAVSLARARADAGRVEAGAAVLVRSHERLLAQLGVARLLAADPSAYEALAAAQGRLRDVESCADDPAGPSSACTAAIATARVAVDDEARDLFARVEVTPEPEERRLASLRRRLGADQALLVSQRVGAERVLFLLDEDRVRYATGAVPTAWAERFVELRRLFVLGPVDPSQTVVDGRALAARVPVVRWAGGRTSASASGWGPPVVVADPRGDLPKSLAQGRALAATFGARFVRGAQATLAATRALLRTRPEWLIYLGHGAVSDRAHWSTRLNLFDGPLGVYALLEDRASARMVMLIGCGTGATPFGQGIGLAEVLVRQGADAVLASVDEVPDGASGQFVRDFSYAARDQRPELAFRAAVAAAEDRGDPVWRRFRLWQGR